MTQDGERAVLARAAGELSKEKGSQLEPSEALDPTPERSGGHRELAAPAAGSAALNAEVTRAWLRAVADDDTEGARRLVAHDAVLHVAAPADVGADHRGAESVLEWHRQRREAAPPGSAYVVHDLLTSDEHAVALLSGRGRAGDEQSWRQVAVYHVRDGRIAEIWVHEDVAGLPERA